MPYSSTEVLKHFVKSDETGSRCSKISDIYDYLHGKSDRFPLNLNSGNTNISNGHKIIDVVVIGLDYNSLPSKRKLDPVVISLDLRTFSQLNLSADTTIAESNFNYYGNHQPMYLNYVNKLLKLPGSQIKFSDLNKCNRYLSTSRGLAYCGPVSWVTTSHRDNDYWNSAEKNLSNYNNDTTNYDVNGMSELTALFYSTDIIDQLQIRLGYRMPNHNDMYHWSNWLVASDNGNGGVSSRYYKIMYLTEFDYYMHAGVMSTPSRIDARLVASTEFSDMIAQIVDPSSLKITTSSDMQYYASNTLTKGSILPAGQFIYSKDYKFKLHLSHVGNLNVWEFPIINDDISVCKAKMLTPRDWIVRPDTNPSCYLTVQDDGNLVVIGNPKNRNMFIDVNYWSVLNSFKDHGGTLEVRSRCGTIRDPKYIFQCVNSDGNVNTYPILNENDWVNPNSANGYMRDLSENGANGRLYENYGDTSTDRRNTVFRCSSNNNNDNSFGTGGKNTWSAVINLRAPAGYTKEPMYLWRNQSGRNYLYAVFKRTPPRFINDNMRNNAIIIISNFMRTLNPMNTRDVSGFQDSQLYAIMNSTTNRQAVNLINIYTNTNNNDFNNDGQLYSGNTIVSFSGTNGNVYFAMSDYRIVVNNGGTIMAVNAGRMDKLGNDQVGFIAGSNSSQWKYTNDKYDTECIHGWKYINTDGVGIPDLKQIVDLTKQGDTKNWCYRNPFLMYTDSDGTMYKFGAANMQQVLWINGDYQSNVDTIYKFLTSDFMEKAKASGYRNVNDINTSVTGTIVSTNFCMRGNRWTTDAKCKIRALSSQTNIPSNTLSLNLSDSLKRVIDYDIKTRICADPISISEKNLCAIIKPTDLSVVETSLLNLDPQFAHAFDGVSTGSAGITNPTGAYGIQSINALFNIIRDTIAKNATSLTEPQLLYLRKFYTTTNPDIDGLIYNNIRIFAYKHAYLSGEEPARVSPDGKYFLKFQSDGNLVAYQNGTGTPAIWNSGTHGNPNSTLVTQSDGNIVIYNSNGATIWSTGTVGSSNPTVLAIDNNGIVIVLRLSGSWNVVWTSNGLDKYVFNRAVVINTASQIDKSLWYSMYQRTAKLDPLPIRNDITYPNHPPMAYIYYRNHNGLIIGWTPLFDTNVLRSKGNPLTRDANTFMPNSNLWKYFLGTMDINFPTQLIPISHNELINSRADSDPIRLLLTSSTTPYERQIWTMDGTSPGNILVYRLISDVALIHYHRTLKKNLSDNDFNLMCGKNLNACHGEYLSLVSHNVTTPHTNAICDVAIIGSGAHIMKNDPNYKTIIDSYTPDGGFANGLRTYAIIVVKHFMNRSKISGNPQAFSDSQLYSILIGTSNPSGELNGLSSLFNIDNAQSIEMTCNNTFGMQTCNNSDARYDKATFKNRERFIGRGGTKFSSRVELFSGSNCLEICNDPNMGQDVQDACKTGAIAYCSKDENIFGPNCTKDSTIDSKTKSIKYPELVDIKYKWCTDNKTHINYTKNKCPSLIPTTQLDISTIVIIISIVLAIFLSIFVIYRKRKANADPLMINSIPSNVDQIKFNLMSSNADPLMSNSMPSNADQIKFN